MCRKTWGLFVEEYEIFQKMYIEKCETTQENGVNMFDNLIMISY